jgi:AcrR family transcriptional regulator
VAERGTTRAYRSAVREQGASATRARILAAARALFAQQGYARAPVADIAHQARVSVDTVYASVGRKPALVLAVVDDILGEGSGPVGAEQRRYVAAVRAASGARAKLAAYAAALARVNPEVAPLLRALARAGEEDPGCAQAWHEVDERRAGNMLLLAADLRQTGEVRDDLTDADVATLVWSTNGWEYFEVLARRGVTGERYAAYLTDLWVHALLAR